MDEWKRCKNILVIRADNMGDVLMSSPAIHALRNFTGAVITLMTSVNGAEAAHLNPDVDQVITVDLPWIKTDSACNGTEVSSIVELLKGYGFDGCVIFTVYSQSPLPAAMVTYMAEIPLRLAYCRENPYDLLSDWVPDPEPYTYIRHQVQRDLDLVAAIGAFTDNKRLSLILPEESRLCAARKLHNIGLNIDKPYLVIHPGVSELKREYPFEKWVLCIKRLQADLAMPLLLTGSAAQAAMLNELEIAGGPGAYAAGGLLSLNEFAAVLKSASVIVSVNTGTVHLAAAMQTPVVVLYAQTNPQHAPWMVPCVVLEYSIGEHLKSRNEVIKFVDQKRYATNSPLPDEFQVIEAVTRLLISNGTTH
ncbi:MAG TPA: glycosyltransferase family 9 protein [Pedobacter sp.]|nr:glycosyltransferase family 9 protein [Pedobacter sp.]